MYSYPMLKIRLLLPAALAWSAAALAPLAQAQPPGQWFWISVDSAEIRIPKVDSIARRLGYDRVKSRFGENSLSYQEHAFVPPFHFTSARPGYSSRSGAWDSTWAVGFLGAGRLDAILASAYLQEVRPGFRDTFPAFREYREISPSGFDNRLWLSAGWAWQHALRDNAVTPAWQRNFWVPFGYTVDGLAAIVLVAAAAPGLKPEQRLGAAGFALGFTLFERVLMLPLGRLSMRQHNLVVRSGYRIPDESKASDALRAPAR
jgi:hypothetical protein